MCAPSVGTKLSVHASCSKYQGTSHLMENGAPSNRPLYHCTFCEKDGHQESFCYRRAKHMWRAHSSRPLIGHCTSHDMNSCEPRKKPHFTDGFYDSFSSGLGHDRGHASSASCVGP